MLQYNCDNMKNKGFTLIELIITITLVAILSIAMGVSLSGMLARQREKEYAEYIEEIEKAACVYAEIKQYSIGINYEIEIKELIEEGLLSKDKTNPKDGKELIEYQYDKVTIRWENNEKICEYNID